MYAWRRSGCPRFATETVICATKQGVLKLRAGARRVMICVPTFPPDCAMKKFLFCLSLMLCGAAFAAELDDANALFDKKSYPQAMQLYTKLANA
ncbi:hypothetical protein LP420_31220 [Massilia sp. B-10]|nr:hypothetical protein LP420_31220 [Massilia sp. B-10]